MSSHYGLLGPDLLPNPDYWVTLAFKKLFTGYAYQVIKTKKKLRVYVSKDESTTNYLVVNYSIRFIELVNEN